MTGTGDKLEPVSRGGIAEGLASKKDKGPAKSAVEKRSDPSKADDRKAVMYSHEYVVGLCTLNQVYPYPIAYNLSNP